MLVKPRFLPDMRQQHLALHAVDVLRELRRYWAGFVPGFAWDLSRHDRDDLM